MQREGAIRFTQLIAEKDYRWLHISYVPGMLRNQIIDVNINVDVNENDNFLPEGLRLQAALLDADKPASTLTLSLEEKPSLSLKKDYQDSG